MVKKKRVKKGKWRHNYRLIILNDNTFEERFSLKLNRLNVFVVTCLSAVSLIALTTVLIAFTSLREFIPGYSSSQLRRQSATLVKETDSLKQQLALNNQQYDRIKKVLKGDISTKEYEKIDSVAKAQVDKGNISLKPIKEDLALRKEVKREDTFSVTAGATAKTKFIFFPPLKGSISEGFNPKIKHYAVDITAQTGRPVKAAANGTVIFSSWASETGYTMIIEHANGIITVYKHMSQLNKGQNDQVSSGEVIGSVGNTGELTTGPHLHFELWNDGYPLDPVNFINFQ
jgi:murein DD-endopeptidase MepM/ murein hydrolase activator NlpD